MDSIDNYIDFKWKSNHKFNIKPIGTCYKSFINNPKPMKKSCSSINIYTKPNHISQINMIVGNNNNNMNINTNENIKNKLSKIKRKRNCYLYSNNNNNNNSYGACYLYKKFNQKHKEELKIAKIKIHFLHSKDIPTYNSKMKQINNMSNMLIREKMHKYYIKNELNYLPMLSQSKINTIINN